MHKRAINKIIWVDSRYAPRQFHAGIKMSACNVVKNMKII